MTPKTFSLLCSLALVVPTTACGPKIPAGAKSQTPATQPPSAQATPASPTKIAARSLELKIPSSGIELEGLLDLPAGNGPFPAVVLVHGSGPQSRDQAVRGQAGMGFPQPIAVFEELSHGLRDRGFAVLRYDKRSCTKKSGCNNSYPDPSPEVVVQDFMNDAKAALKLLAARSDIDAKQLFVVGHSQGAGFVPSILKQDPSVARGVAIAPPGASFSKTLDTQVRKIMSLVPAGQEKVAQAQLKPLIEDIDKLKAIESGKQVEGQVLNAPAKFIESQVAQSKDAIDIVKTLDRPVLVLRGGYDWNISNEDFQEWKDALASSTLAAKHQALELPEISHALNRITQPDVTKLGPSDIGTQVDPKVIEAIADFLDSK